MTLTGSAQIKCLSFYRSAAFSEEIRRNHYENNMRVTPDDAHDSRRSLRIVDEAAVGHFSRKDVV